MADKITPRDKALWKSLVRNRTALVRLLLLLVLLSLIEAASTASAPAQQATPREDGPIKVLPRCPFASDERVLLPNRPEFDRYLKCVSKYNSDYAVIQATSWIKDWFDATDCIYYCDNVGIQSIAHVSMWRGLRYIVARGITADMGADASCRRAQRSISAAIDDRINHLIGYAAHTSETAECTAQMTQDATKESLKRINGYRSEFFRHLRSWEEDHK